MTNRWMNGDRCLRMFFKMTNYLRYFKIETEQSQVCPELMTMLTTSISPTECVYDRLETATPRYRIRIYYNLKTKL